MTNDKSFIKHSDFVNTGGNIMNDIIVLRNGYIIRISDEGLSVYPNEKADEHGEAVCWADFVEDESKLIFREGTITDRNTIDVVNYNDEKLLTIENGVGSHDYKAMELAGLDPEKNEDVFTYVNHLLGDKFTNFEGL